MKLSTREDIEAPIEAVFEQITDFDSFERAALRRGADVVRTDTLQVAGLGMAWKASFDYRGRERKANLKVIDFDTPNGMRLQAISSGLETELMVELVAMSRNRTRMNLSLDARPQTIPARLVIQSMKLARQNLNKQFRRRIADFAADIEERCKNRTA